MRSEPLGVCILQETAYSSGSSFAKGANRFASFANVSANSLGTGLNSTPAYKSSVFSRKTTKSIPSLKFNGLSGKALQGRKQIYKSNNCRMRTIGER